VNARAAAVTRLDEGAQVIQHPASSALAVVPGQAEWTAAQVAALAQIGVGAAPPGDQLVFLNFAQRTGLDPFARQIYMIGRNDRSTGTTKWTIQASIDGLRIVAQRSGEYTGQVGPEWCGPDGAWRDVWLEAEPPTAARVGVLRRGFAQPLYAVALFREYASTRWDRESRGQVLTGLWASKPAVMIAKCAEALALRKAFPMDLSGLYTAEEMSQVDVEAPAPVAAPQVVPAASPGRDWLAEVAALTDADALRALYTEAVASIPKGPERTRVQAAITDRAAAVAQPQQHGDSGDVVDAEVVED
jgi:phage recombination protein Bet